MKKKPEETPKEKKQRKKNDPDVLGVEEGKRQIMMDLFIQEFRKRGLITKSAKAIGAERSLIYQWIDKFPEFAQRVEDAKQEVLEAVEEEAYRRALEGTERDEYYKGEVIGQYREFSDRLLEILLKALAPHKYKDTFAFSGKMEHKHSGDIGVSMQDVLNELDKREKTHRIGNEGQDAGAVRPNGERGPMDLCETLTVHRCGPDGGDYQRN